MSIEQKLFFKNSKGNQLCGILSNPTGDKNKLIIILVHGFQSSKNSTTYQKLKENLNHKDISSFRIDLYGHGESKGDIKDITISEAVDDILQAIDFIKGLGYLKLALCGSSFGGIASTMAASKTDELSFLVLKCPVSDYNDPKLITQKENDFFNDAKKNNGYEAAPKIKIPTLIVHGDTDRSVPVKQSIKLSKLLPNSRLEIIHGADHRFERPEEFAKMINLITDFIVENARNNL